MRFAESEAAPSTSATLAFPAWLREQRERPDAVGAGARVLLRTARAPGAWQATIACVLGLAASRLGAIRGPFC
jgi:hypothetical protein